MRNFVIYAALVLITLQGTHSQEKYSKEPLSRDSINLALSYGLQAIELNQSLSKVIENQKSQIVIYKGLVSRLELSVDLLEEKIVLQKKSSFFRRIWAGLKFFGLGLVTGALLML